MSIQLPSEFDTVEAKNFQPFENPPAGPYKLIVVNSDEKPTEGGEQMLTLHFDIADGQYKGAFGQYPKIHRTVLAGKSLEYFKGMMGAFKASNDKSKMIGIIDAERKLHHEKFRGLVIGGNIRDEEYRNKQGQVKMGLGVGYLFPIAEMDKHKPMPAKLLKPQTNDRPSGGSHAQQSAPPHTEDDLPF